MKDILSESPVLELLRLWAKMTRRERLALRRMLWATYHPQRVWLIIVGAPLDPILIGAQ